MNSTKVTHSAPKTGRQIAPEKIPGYVPGIKGVASGIATWHGTANLAPANAKYAVAVDWLELILESQDVLINYGVPLDQYEYALGKIRLERLPYGSRYFLYGYAVHLEGRLIGKLFCSPRISGHLKSNCVQFKIENNLFYEAGWLDSVKFIFDKMSFTVRNVSRMDISLDGKGFFWDME